jgi:predicted nucleic acid-binding protein
MNLVDSCGWLEFFAGGPNAAFFAYPIEAVDALLVPTICILEVFKRVREQRGEAAALQAVAHMQEGHITPLDVATALNAARISADLKLPLADSVIIAAAQAHAAVVWTQDADLRDLPGVQYRPRQWQVQGR